MIIHAHSRGHYPDEFFDVPEHVYEKVKNFSNRFPVWSDAYNKHEKELEEIRNLLAPYEIEVPSFCSYC